VKNFEIAREFDLMADLLEIRGENPFRIQPIGAPVLTEDLEVLAREEGLDQISVFQEELRRRRPRPRLEAGPSAPAGGCGTSMRPRYSG
jgi:hypothetical protein